MQKSTCAALNAMVMQNKSKFQHMAVTGVVASKCGRHDFFLRGSVVDLQYGERCGHIKSKIFLIN